MGITITNCKSYLPAKVLNKEAVPNCSGDFLGTSDNQGIWEVA